MENLLGQFFSVSESPQVVVDDVIALYELKKDIMCCVYARDGYQIHLMRTDSA